MKVDKSPVHIREKKLKNGNVSLYLDIYVDGVRSYEFLNIYIVPEKTRADKEMNQRGWITAKQRRNEVEIEILNGKSDFKHRTKRTTFSKCASDYASQFGRSAKFHYKECAEIFSQVAGRDFFVDEITPQMCFSFISHLISNYNPPTIDIMVKKLNCTLNFAVSLGLIRKSPLDGLKYELPKVEPRPREFLSEEELRKLASTDCRDENAKRAFLFACFTGLRLGDARDLKWNDIVLDNGEYSEIVIKQEKTSLLVRIPISINARKYLVQNDSDFVFSIPYKYMLKAVLDEWACHAGIRKRITFHTARHTFATLLITNGVDIYTTSKLLGHASVNTTQIYAKLVDEKRRSAINKLPSI